MESEVKYNMRSIAVKRIMREAEELKQATQEYCAHPLRDNLFEWHFTVRGPPATDFDGGIYHGRIILPVEYPMKPPSIIMLTPNGRFQTNKRICLNMSGQHLESWQPSWSIRTALLALIAFMPTTGSGKIRALVCSREERQALARKSLQWECPDCGRIQLLLSDELTAPPTQEESELIGNIGFKEQESLPVRLINSDDEVDSFVTTRIRGEVSNRRNALIKFVLWVVTLIILFLLLRRLYIFVWYILRR